MKYIKMKYLNLYLVFFSIGILSSSCTDVIDVAVPTAEPRLVIDASIDCLKGEKQSIQSVRLTKSMPFFSPKDKQSPVKGASVKIINNDTSEEFTFKDQNDGTYVVNNFKGVIDNTYTLEVVYDKEIYRATEKLLPLSGIASIEQTTQGGWDPDVLKAKITIQDVKNVDNYYLVKYKRRGDKLPSLISSGDEFTDGNLISIYCDHDDNEREYQIGDTIDIGLYSISKNYYNYVELLVEQLKEARGGNVFSAPPVNLKSNCINTTNPKNYALGYFRITTADKRTIVFK